MAEVFPDGEKVKVNWWSGILIAPYGRIKKHVNVKYASTYEKYVVIESDTGTIINEKKMKEKEFLRFKNDQFEAYRLTNEYKQLSDSMLAADTLSSPQFVADYMRIHILDYATKILVK